MSSNKREVSDDSEEVNAKREKIDADHEHLEENKESCENQTQSEDKQDNASNGGEKVEADDDQITKDDASDKTDQDKKTKPDGCGSMLICGGTNWDLIGRKDLPKSAKGKGTLGGRNLWGPHRYKSLKGIRVRKAVSGNSSCHSVIITESGKAMTWGRNEKGQLGSGDEKRRDIPTLVEKVAEHTVVDASCGRAHTLLLTDKGLVFGFGDNKLGQCGIGSNVAVITTPTQLSYSGAPLVRVACGAEFSMVVDVRGFIFSFGCPEYGQLGHNSDGKYFVTSNKMSFNCETSPRRITLFIEKSREGHVIPVENVTVKDVACGVNHTVAVDVNKRVFSWGFGGYGRLGHSCPKDEMVPRNVKFFDMPKRGAHSVYAGGMYSMAIGEMGALFFWGQTKSAGEATMYPKPVHDLTGWEIRSVGCSNKSIVVSAEDSVISWGPSPTYGELGYGENRPKSSTVPQEVKSLQGMFITNVSCGFGHTLLVVRDSEPGDTEKIEKIPEYDP